VDKSGRPRTNPVQPAPICSHDVPQTNENPGALAGASGATVKANQLHSKEYTDAPAAARRVDLNGGWTLARWDWKRAVRKDRTLSDAAKLLAAALCDDFAHHETAFCNPTVETLADALGKTVRPVQRALAELRDAQWITIKYAEGRGKKSEISFLGGHGISALKPSEKVTHMASRDAKGVSSVAPIGTKPMAERVPANAQKGARYDTPYNKDKPKLNQKERAQGAEAGSQRLSGRPDYSAYDRATAPGKWERPLHPIPSDGYRAEAWNNWLARHGFPSLSQIAPKNPSGELGVPFPMPPYNDDPNIENLIARNWVQMFSRNAKERANF